MSALVYLYWLVLTQEQLPFAQHAGDDGEHPLSPQSYSQSVGVLRRHLWTYAAKLTWVDGGSSDTGNAGVWFGSCHRHSGEDEGGDDGETHGGWTVENAVM